MSRMQRARTVAVGGGLLIAAGIGLSLAQTWNPTFGYTSTVLFALLFFTQLGCFSLSYDVFVLKTRVKALEAANAGLRDVLSSGLREGKTPAEIGRDIGATVRRPGS